MTPFIIDKPIVNKPGLYFYGYEYCYTNNCNSPYSITNIIPSTSTSNNIKITTSSNSSIKILFSYLLTGFVIFLNIYLNIN